MHKSDSVGLQETFTQHLIASRRYRYRLDKYVYIACVHKFASKDSTRLSYDRDVIPTKTFKKAPVVKNLRFLAVVPREKLHPVLLAHLIHAVIRDVRDEAYMV